MSFLTLPNQPTAQIVTANQQIVDELLLANTSNRNIRKSRVEVYERLIREGKWMLTNNGIGLSSTGVLIDGQHRLEAIKAAGYPPVQFVLVTNLSIETQLVVDQNARRTARDALRMLFDQRVAKAAPAICNIIHRDACKQWGGYSIPIITMVDVLEQHQVQIETVCEIPTNSTFFAAPYLAAVVVTMKAGIATFDHAWDFLKAVELGENLTKKDPAFHLRNLIFSTRRLGAGGAVQRDRFMKTLNAFYKHIAGEKIERLYACDPRKATA